MFSIHPFGEEEATQVSRKVLAHIAEARVEEIFHLVMQEIKRSGYDGLLPAGMVLTGGTANLPGIRSLASEVTGLPVRVAQPEDLVGLVDKLHSPEYSTSIGLLHWAMYTDAALPSSPRGPYKKGEGPNWDSVKSFFRNLLP